MYHRKTWSLDVTCMSLDVFEGHISNCLFMIQTVWERNLQYLWNCSYSMGFDAICGCLQRFQWLLHPILQNVISTSCATYKSVTRCTVPSRLSVLQQCGDSLSMRYVLIPSRQLTDFIIDEYFPETSGMGGDDRYLGLFSTVVSKTAEMIALWMSVGFAHGNCSNFTCEKIRHTLHHHSLKCLLQLL